MRSLALPMALALLLSSCATGYHSVEGPISGWTGGYWDQPGPGELLKVGFDGNGYIDRDTITAYLMYHCADLAQKRHKPYFRMFQSLPDAIRGAATDELAVGRVGGKLDDWVYLLFDDQKLPGDQETAKVLENYRSKIGNTPGKNS
jgi:hypothetical protein